jgi:hypothetical protein
MQEIPSNERGKCGQEMTGNFADNGYFHVTVGISYMPQICDMRQMVLLLLRKEGMMRIFFALKNPTASAGFEPANLGTKDQHATSRPLKPLWSQLQCKIL